MKHISKRGQRHREMQQRDREQVFKGILEAEKKRLLEKKSREK